jgi:excisionase family DNA binding protein
MRSPLLTARAVAEVLGVSTETVLRWVRRGELPAIRLPSGALRFPLATLDEWLAAPATPRQGVLTTTTGAATRPLIGLTIAEDKE